MATTQTVTRRKFYWDQIRHNIGQILLYGGLLLGCLLTLLPFVWMLFGSFKSSGEIIQLPPTFWPKNPTLDNYRDIFNDPHVPLARFYLNSLIVTVSVVILTLFTSSLAGYIFAKYQFYGKMSCLCWCCLPL